MRLLVIICLTAFCATSCRHSVLSPSPGPNSPDAADLAPFKDQARTSSCAELSNKLYLIDGMLVLWARTGRCPDGSYLVRLTSRSVRDELCTWADSIAGPHKSCTNDRYRPMFEIIILHLDAPDLGLGAGHTVTPIPF